jgi:RNA polymerase-binding transcription factor DksA
MALRDYLLRRQGDLTKDALEEQPSYSTHMADAGTDNYDRDFALGMLSSEQDARYEIEQAIDRIRNGAYGKCELTGKPIEPERLEAIPWTRFSARAEKQLEQEGALKRASLGPRDTVAKGQPAGSEEPAESAESAAENGE